MYVTFFNHSLRALSLVSLSSLQNNSRDGNERVSADIREVIEKSQSEQRPDMCRFVDVIIAIRTKPRTDEGGEGREEDGQEDG